MKPSLHIPFPDRRAIEDRRSKSMSLLSALKWGGQRKSFRRRGEGQNRYVDRLSFRTFVLTLLIFTLSTLDAFFTIIHLQNGGSELNPLMRQIIQSGFGWFILFKSLGIGVLAWLLAIHQNFSISFYGMHFLTAIYSALLAYHLIWSYPLWRTLI